MNDSKLQPECSCSLSLYLKLKLEFILAKFKTCIRYNTIIIIECRFKVLEVFKVWRTLQFTLLMIILREKVEDYRFLNFRNLIIFKNLDECSFYLGKMKQRWIRERKKRRERQIKSVKDLKTHATSQDVKVLRHLTANIWNFLTDYLLIDPILPI